MSNDKRLHPDTFNTGLNQRIPWTDDKPAPAAPPEMTPTQARTYLLNRGTTCPFCDSPAIEGTELTVDEGVCTQGISCTECNREWTDLYRLIGVCNDTTGKTIVSQTAILPELMGAIRALMNDLSFHVQTTRFRPSDATTKTLERVRDAYKEMEDAGVSISD
jgi:hypothetical protein